MKVKLIVFLLLLSGCGDTLPDVGESCTRQTLGLGDTRSTPTNAVAAAGQSNMAGHGAVTVTPNLPNVVVFEDGHWQTYAPPVGSCHGPELSFLTAYATDHPNETIGLIKHAIPGSDMSYWTPGAVYYDEWTAKIDLAGVPLMAILWNQGETEATKAAYAPHYEPRTRAMINDLRSRYGLVPFVFSLTEISIPAAQWRNVVRQAQVLIASDTQLACLVTMDGIPTLTDFVHYGSLGHTELGQRYYDVLTSCV